MKLDRRTVNFGPGEASFLDCYREAGTPEQRVLLSLLPDASTDSDSSILKALIHLAHRQIQEAAMRTAYDQAVEGGEFDVEARAAMHRGRKTIASMVAEEA